MTKPLSIGFFCVIKPVVCAFLVVYVDAEPCVVGVYHEKVVISVAVEVVVGFCPVLLHYLLRLAVFYEVACIPPGYCGVQRGKRSYC